MCDNEIKGIESTPESTSKFEFPDRIQLIRQKIRDNVDETVLAQHYDVRFDGSYLGSAYVFINGKLPQIHFNLFANRKGFNTKYEIYTTPKTEIETRRYSEGTSEEYSVVTLSEEDDESQ